MKVVLPAFLLLFVMLTRGIYVCAQTDDSKIENKQDIFKADILHNLSQVWNSSAVSRIIQETDASKINAFNKRDNQKLMDQVTFLPDTIIIYSTTENPKRHTFLHNNNGKLLVTITKQLENGSWVNRAMESRSYDSQGNVSSVTTQIWSAGSWSNATKVTHTYENFQILTSTWQNWESGQWLNNYRINNSLDVVGNIVATLRENWHEGQWVNDFYELLVYDANNNLLNLTRQKWNEVYWLNEQYLEFTYNTNNTQATAEYQVWSMDAWQKVYREEFTYDSQLNISQYIGKSWLGSGWIFSDKLSYTYTSAGELESALHQTWQTTQWLNFSNSFYTYNQFGSILSSISQLWIGNQWVNQDLLNNVFDEDGNTTGSDYFTWNGSTWEQINDGLLELNYSYGSKNLFFTGYQAYAKYVSLLVGLQNMHDNVVLIWPNPVTDMLHISVSDFANQSFEIILHTLSGQKIISEVAFSLTENITEKSIDLSNLISGSYILSVRSESQVFSKKLIKK